MDMIGADSKYNLAINKAEKVFAEHASIALQISDQLLPKRDRSAPPK